MSLLKASIIAQNTFSDGFLALADYDGSEGLAISISGTFVATVTTQRSLDGDVAANYRDLSTTTTVEEQTLVPVRNARYRVGVKTGDFTSGTVEIEILA